MTALPLAVFDIDGVLANVTHRLHHLQGKKNWKMFFSEARNDTSHPEGLELLQKFSKDHEIVFLTGRPEHCRAATIKWLELQGLTVNELHMRPRGNFQKSADAKAQLLLDLAAQGRTIDVVIDDDPTVVAAHRANGFNVIHAEWAVPDENFAHAQQQEGKV